MKVELLKYYRIECFRSNSKIKLMLLSSKWRADMLIFKADFKNSRILNESDQNKLILL